MNEQEQLKREYEKQQTPEGKAALQIKKQLLQKFRDINGITLQNAGEIRPLYEASTNKIIRYFVAE